MKKIFLPLAFVTAGFFAFNASAQQPDNTAASKCCEPAQQCCQSAEESCCGATECALVGFEGVTLTPEQQSSVKALNEKYAQARKDGKKAKAEAKKQERKDFKETKKAYLQEMKDILTPEQYVVYLENIVLTTPQQQPQMRQGMKAHKPDAKFQGKKEGKKDGKKDGKRGMKKGQKLNAETPAAVTE